MNSTLTITDARRRIFDLIEEVDSGKYFTLTSKGSPRAVILSADEFESWQETIATLHDIPDLMKDIKKFESDVKAGRHLSYPTLDEVSKKYGKKHVPHSRSTKSTKGVRKASR